MNASSTCAFSVPVWRHWSTNFVFDRFVIDRIVKIDSGIVTRATSASSGEIVIIMISDADDRQRRREQLAQRLLQALREVVDVVGDPAQQVAARLAVDVAQRHPVELVLDVGTQAEHRALHDPGQQRSDCRRGQHRRRRVDREHDEQRVVQLREVDALPAR